jgi:hypothetical protein
MLPTSWAQVTMNLRAVITPRAYASSCKRTDWELTWVAGCWRFNLFIIFFIRNRGPRLALPSVSCQALCVWVLELSSALLVSGHELRATTEGLGGGGRGLFDTGGGSFTFSYLQRLP